MEYPWINPVLFDFGFLQVRWYSIAYILGFIFCYQTLKYFNKDLNIIKSDKVLENALNYGILGVLIGGRIGYVLFYNLNYYIHRPFEIFAVWHGGMSFHGAFLGVIVAFWIYTTQNKISKLSFADVISIGTPFGIMCGRFANFVNGELWGRHTDLSIGFSFAASGDLLPRHPSQLYECFFEGFILMLIMFFVSKKTLFLKDYHGRTFGVFLFFYGLFRFLIEFVREPDDQLGFVLFNFISMGQVLCLPMISCGMFFMFRKSFFKSK